LPQRTIPATAVLTTVPIVTYKTAEQQGRRERRRIR
jgi:hypothetical protein